MIRKELIVNVRGIRIVILMVIFNCVLALIGLISFNQVISDAKYYGKIDYDLIVQLYVWLIAFESILLAFIVPALAAGSISGERERQTLDILLSSSLSTWSIVSGKLISCILSVVLLIVSSIPALSLIYVFGGVGFREMLQTVFFLIYLAFCAGCVGIFCSSVFKKTTSATVSSYGMLLLIGLGTVILYFIMEMIQSAKGNYDTEAYMMILLVNPAFTMVYVLMRQIGGADGFLMTSNPFLEFVTEYWIIISVIVQSALLFLLLFLAAKRLNPQKKRRRRS